MSDPKDGSGSATAANSEAGAGQVGPVSAPKPRRLIVHTLPGKGTVSEAERAAAKTVLERDFGAYERFRKSLPKEEPPTTPSKTIPVWPAGVRQPVDLVRFLTDTLQRLGYVPVGRNVYQDRNELGFRASWSSPAVEHFVSFASRGRPNQYLSANVSLGHPSADRFAAQERLNYLPPAYRDVYARQPVWQRPMWFPLGKAASWGPRFSLDMAERSISQLAKEIERAVRDFAIAKLSSVMDVASMFDLGARDEEPFRWSEWGDSPRVAMVAYLGRKLGRPIAELRPALIPHVESFKSPPDTSEPTAAEFVDRVLADADALLSRPSA